MLWWGRPWGHQVANLSFFLFLYTKTISNKWLTVNWRGVIMAVVVILTDDDVVMYGEWEERRPLKRIDSLIQRLTTWYLNSFHFSSCWNKVDCILKKVFDQIIRVINLPRMWAMYHTDDKQLSKWERSWTQKLFWWLLKLEWCSPVEKGSYKEPKQNT